MNIILIDVFENTVRRHGSFNPVSSENQYTRLKFIFKEGDVWDGCTAVTASFFLSADNVVSKVEEMGEDLTVTFPIPAEFTGQNGRLYVGIQGTYVEDGEIKTVSTNIIAITRATGAIVGEGVEQSLWEQLMAYLYENRFDRTVFEKKFGTIVSVTAEGVKNDGTLTDLSLAMDADAEDTVYYFPKGTYRSNGFSFSGARNVTILAPEAKVVFNGTGTLTKLIEFINCDGIRLLGGEFDGSGLAQTGIQLNNTPNSVIRDVFVHNIGNAELEYTAGIDAVNDCSHIILDNVRIDGVHAGRVTATGSIKIPGQDEYVAAGYIFATGIRIHNGSSGFSKDILINHPVINDIGYLGEENNKVNYVSEIDEESHTYTDGGEQHVACICYGKNAQGGSVACISDIITTETINNADAKVARIDGDGIHIAQRPDEMNKRDWYEDEGKSYAVIRNPQITNCAKRALKIAARCVEVDGGNIDVSTWATAVGFQFTDDSAIRNTRIHNGASTCLTVIADGRMTVENCAFSSTNGVGNGLAMTLEASFSDAQDNPIAPLPENLLVRNCRFDDVNVPVIAMLTSVSETKADSNSVRIEDCEIGFFKGEAAIYLSPSRFNSIKNLVIRDNIFRFGSSTAAIHAANAERYGQNNIPAQSVLYLGTPADGGHVDPIELLEVNNPALSEDFDEVFRLYRFTAARRYLGGSPARADWVYDYPELLKLDAKSQTTEDSITYSVDYNGVISVSAAEGSTIRKVWIPLKKPIVFNGNEVYELIVTPNKLNSPKVSVRLYTTNSMSSVDNMITIAGLNNLDRHVIISDTSKTATYLAVVCSPESGSSVGIESGTEFTVSLKSRTPIVKGLNRIDDCYTKMESDGRYLQSHQSLSNYYNKTESDARYLQSHQDISGKADKATTLNGYGITDAYTKSYIDAKLLELGGANVVNSVSEMADTARMYVLASTGHIWRYAESYVEPQNEMTVQSGNLNKRISGVNISGTTSSGAGTFIADEIAVDLTGSECSITFKNFAPKLNSYTSTTSYKESKIVALDSSHTAISTSGITLSHRSNTYELQLTASGNDMIGDLIAYADKLVTNGAVSAKSQIKYIVICVTISASTITASDLTGLEMIISNHGGYQSAWTDTGITYGGGNEAALASLDARITSAESNLAAVASSTGSAVIPSFWNEEVADTVSKIKALQEQYGNDLLCFGWCSDMHIPANGTAYEQNLGAVASRVMDECDIPLFLVTGDMLTADTAQTSSSAAEAYKKAWEYLRPIGSERILAVKGNHDAWFGNDGNDTYYVYGLPPEKLHRLLFRPQEKDLRRSFGADGSYFYVDDDPQKVRFICLNSQWANYEENQDGTAKYSTQKHSGFGQAQLDWLIGDALNVKEGYSIIIAFHVPPTAQTYTSYASTYREYELFRGIITAFCNKTSYSGSYTHSGSGTYLTEGEWADVSVNCNFGNYNGSLLALFCGHSHRDQAVTGDLPVPIVCITSAINTPYDTNSSVRVQGTSDETALDFACVNTKTGHIDLIRCGYGSDRSISATT